MLIRFCLSLLACCCVCLDIRFFSLVLLGLWYLNDFVFKPVLNKQYTFEDSIGETINNMPFHLYLLYQILSDTGGCIIDAGMEWSGILVQPFELLFMQ